MTKLTPQVAAQQANVSRGTIMNAIKNNSLMARRDNRNRWQITSEDLSNWMASRSDISTDSSANFDSEKVEQEARKTIRIAVLEAEIEAKDKRISDLEQERDARLRDKDKQIDLIRQDKDAQIAEIKTDRDRWAEHAKQFKSVHIRRRWWPF